MAKVLFLACAIVTIVNSRELPSLIHKCSLDDANLNTCLTNSIYDALPRAAQYGVPEMHIPPMDPFLLPKAELKVNGISGSFSNVSVHGFKGVQIRSFDFDPKQGLLSFRISFPSIKMVGDYAIDGNVLFAKIKAAGKGWVIGNNINLGVVMKVNLKERNDKQYYVPKEPIITELTYEDATVYLDDLVPGNKDATFTINQLLNQNLKNLIEAWKDFVKGLIASNFHTLSKSAFSRYSADELFA